MSRRARTCGLLMFAACALAAVPSPAAAQTTFGQIRETRTLPPGEVTPFSITCPPGFSATSGAVVSLSGNVVTIRSRPLGRGRWSFAFDNRGSTPVEVSVVVNCMDLRPPKKLKRKAVRIVLKTRVKKVTLLPGRVRTVRVNCPPRQAPVGYGAETESGPGGSRARARKSGIGTIGDVVLNKAMPVLGGWVFQALPVGQGQRDLLLYARCVPRVATASAPGRDYRIKLEVSRMTYMHTVRFLQNDGITRGCPRGRSEVRDGHEFPESEAGRIFLSTSWSNPRGVTTWNIFSTVQTDVEVRLYQLCFRRVGTWRRNRLS